MLADLEVTGVTGFAHGEFTVSGEPFTHFARRLVLYYFFNKLAYKRAHVHALCAFSRSLPSVSHNLLMTTCCMQCKIKNFKGRVADSQNKDIFTDTFEVAGYSWCAPGAPIV